MYSYVHTLGTKIYTDLEKKLLNPYVNKYLFSLIAGLRQKNFGYDTLFNITKDIKQLYSTIDDDKDLIIDSGGYSIIVGDVNPNDITKFIHVYNDFFKNQYNFYDYIMSLDIPIFLEYKDANTVSNIAKFNFHSLSISKNVLLENPKLYDKFIFVWHFKIKKQFDIWKYLYKRLFFDDKNLKNFAIGGLVGLRGMTNIKFSPFLGPIFLCLKLIEDRNLNDTSLIHILGVYALYDRFIMIFLDKLFNRIYLKDKNCKVNITFDTVSYLINGLYSVRRFPALSLPFIDINENKIHHDFNDFHKIIETYFPDIDVRKQILIDLENIAANKEIEYHHLSSLGNVIYHTLIDFIFNYVIERDNLLDLFLNAKNYNQLKIALKPIYTKWCIEFPEVFPNIEDNILNNLLWVHSFHLAYSSNCDLSRLEAGIDKFISAINYPFDLAGDFKFNF